jgi:hypothetical protein
VGIINSSNNNNDKKSTFDFTAEIGTETTSTTPTTTFFTKFNNYNNNIKISKESAFENVIECGLTMIQANSILNENLHGNGLPSIAIE